MQTDYAKRMEKWGLKRGITNEKRKHITTGQFYKYINANELDAKKILSNEHAQTLVGKMLQELQGEKKIEHLKELTKSKQKNYYHENEREISERTKQPKQERSKDQSKQRGPSLGY
jgi:hypothetical protein